MLCNKIFENPRKGFVQLLTRGMNKIKKRIYFRTLSHGMFHGHPNVQVNLLYMLCFWYTLLKVTCSVYG